MSGLSFKKYRFHGDIRIGNCAAFGGRDARVAFRVIFRIIGLKNTFTMTSISKYIIWIGNIAIGAITIINIIVFGIKLVKAKSIAHKYVVWYK